MEPNAQMIAAALGGRPAGDRRWKSSCPAHEDEHPSLAIAEGESGKVLLKCWAGCTQEEVLQALRGRGLWPKRSDSPSIQRTPAPAQLVPADPEPEWELEELDRLLADAELMPADAPYMVAGQILEDAATVTYHCLSRVAAALNEHGPQAQRHVARWMNERFPDALFGLRP
jgi:hypothetical protein